MAKFKDFPHPNIDVKDESITTPYVEDILPLHIPLFLTTAQKGPIGIPQWGSYSELSEVLGAGTFDRLGPYFKHSTLFLEKALAGNRAFVVRVADESAAVASMVLECTIYNSDVQQYDTDADGVRTKDSDGEFLPIDGVTAPGNTMYWTLRPLAAGENVRTIAKATVNNNGVDYVTYPVIAFEASSPGAWGNVSGFKFSWDKEVDGQAQLDMGAIIYSMSMVTTDYGASTPKSVLSKFIETTVDFTLKPETTDPSTMRRYALGEVIDNEYYDADFPFDYNVYTDNVAEIGTQLTSFEDTTAFPELVDQPFMYNIFTGKDSDGRHYPNLKLETHQDVDADRLLLDQDVIQYLQGGNDGDVADAKFEELCRTWLEGSQFPAIKDQARFPFTHLYDSGFEMETKEAIINFMGVCASFRPVLSTQVWYEEPNSPAEDQSAGGYLKSKAILHPESFIFGTTQFRTTIMQQCGRLNETTTLNVATVPATIDQLMKKVAWHGSTAVKGTPKGLPNSACTALRDINWLPSDDDLKQLSWDNSLNYMQHYDMAGVHYPDVVTVYMYKTSLLSDDLFADYVVYAKHMVRKEWAKFAGMNDPINTLFGLIRKSMTRRLEDAFGSYVRHSVEPYQTEQDRLLGYALSIDLVLQGTMPNRVWNVTIPVRRDDVE